MRHTLGRLVQRRPRIEDFDIAGHDSTMTMTTIGGGFRATYRRAFAGWRSMTWRGRLSLLAAFGVSPGLAMGVGGRAANPGFLFIAYELRVDGSSRGNWVAKHEAGVLTAWTFADSATPLPDRDWDVWPSPRT